MSKQPSNQSQTKAMPKWVRFAFGGTAGMAATCFVQPLDLVKNRMQLSGVGGKGKVTSLSVIKSVIRNEGKYWVLSLVSE